MCLAVTMLSACNDTEAPGASNSETFEEGVDAWLSAVCDDEVDGREVDVPFSIRTVDPVTVRTCVDWETTTALEFEDDPREELAGHEPPPDDVFYCWAKPLSEGHWAAVVIEEYQLDGDPLTDLEEHGFEPCG